MPQYDLYTDGSVKNKIGHYGFVLFLEGKEIDRGWGEAGCGPHMTETIAEYYGLSAGLDSFIRHVDQPNSHLDCHSDCANLVRHLNRVARRDKSSELTMLFWKLDQIRKYATAQVSWVPRYKNVIADALAKSLRSRL
jgi:ribonuclease HI